MIAGADVVVHLAFVIMGDLAETTASTCRARATCSRPPIDAGVQRLVYASSVAAYGFHADNPERLTEDTPARGTDRHYYSAQKAELEAALWDRLRDSSTQAYVFRPCIVAGPTRWRCCRASPTCRSLNGCPASCCARWS